MHLLLLTAAALHPAHRVQDLLWSHNLLSVAVIGSTRPWGDQIVATLKMVGVSQSSFCKALGIDYTTLYRWRTHRPELRIRQFVAFFLRRTLVTRTLEQLQAQGHEYVRVADVLNTLRRNCPALAEPCRAHPCTERHLLPLVTDGNSRGGFLASPVTSTAAEWTPDTVPALPQPPCVHCAHWQRSARIVGIHPCLFETLVDP